jgi:hypothetical protein
MQFSVYDQGKATVVIAAGESIAVATQGVATVSRILGFPNHPDTLTALGTVNNAQTVFGPYASGATIQVEAQAATVFYETGTSPVVQSFYNAQLQPAPVALDATGPLTATAILNGLVTSTTAAAVAGTLPTGAVLDLASEFAVGDSFDWSVIATGANAFTVTAAAGHTIVGTAAVATVTSGRFRTRKTAANTFVTYRMS